jgi:hypothetical protein
MGESLKGADRPRLQVRPSPEQLCEIAKRLVAATDPVEIARLREGFEQGFYGGENSEDAWNSARANSPFTASPSS